MAIMVNRLTVSRPTLNSITLGSGGSLTIGTTYYYRVIAVRYLTANNLNRYCLSAASAEQAVTPTSGNQTAQLSWAAVTDATGYIVQRTTTSGSYPLPSSNSLTLNGQSYSGYPYVTTMTSLNDDGGASSNVRFTGSNIDFATEHTLIEAYGSANDVITLWDIASALAGGGFSDLTLAGPTAHQAASQWRAEGIYLLRGMIVLRDCIFRQYAQLLCISGGLRTLDSVTLEIGSTSTPYVPALLHLGLPLLPVTQNNSTYNTTYAGGSQISGKSGVTNRVRLLVERPICIAGLGIYNRYSNLGDYLNVDLTESLVGRNATEGMALYANDNCQGNVYESAKCYTSIRNSLARVNGFRGYYGQNVILQGCTSRQADYDLQVLYPNLQRAVLVADHAFQSQGQTTNQPYLAIYTTSSGDKSTCAIAITMGFDVKDKFGNAINGATITAINANGYPAFWEDSTATWSTSIAETGDPATWTVSEGTKFSIGDYIRSEAVAEVYRVTNITGNVLDIARAQLGSTLTRLIYNAYGSAKVLKLKTALTTDSSGLATGAFPSIHRELRSASGAGSSVTNYEDTLVSGGSMARTYFGPYTVTVKKDGYKDVTTKILDPDVEKFPLGPQTIKVIMTPLGHPPAPWGA